MGEDINTVFGVFTAGLIVASVMWWIVSRRTEQRNEMEYKLKEMREELNSISSMIHSRIDKKAEQSSFEHDKLWAQIDILRNNTACKAEIENLNRKMEKYMDGLGGKMDTVVDLCGRISDLNARVRVPEDVTKPE